MTKIRESLLRLNAKPRVASDLPGRLRLVFPRYSLLPEGAEPYLHYAEDVLMLLPGVESVQLNLRIGTALILYDRACLCAADILRWVETATDVGFEVAGEAERRGIRGEEALRTLARERLLSRLPRDTRKKV